MDSEGRDILYLERAKNELDLARMIFRISPSPAMKLDLGLKEDQTFFSNAIGNSYYCIFYSAKALLTTNGIETRPPEEHQKTLDEFERLVESGKIDKALLEIYRSMVVKADELLGIFQREKSKRGKFTYRKLPQANLMPAEESLESAGKFLKNVNLLIRQNKSERG
ncbi:MAG: hypothetical protein NTY20_00015 [Candidatus Aenigmarchaeota archaeon]|nr:hypothetical protein [Candidatus Aenigmarchaeota archaeon]